MSPTARKARTGDFDKRLGAEIRRLRKARDLTQSGLAARLGITFQQVQKYENGMNRVPAAQLNELAAALDVTVAFLLQAGEDTSAVRAPDTWADIRSRFLSLPPEEQRQLALELVAHLMAAAPQRASAGLRS